MLNLLRIEWMKIKTYKTFWILATLFLVSIAGVNYFIYNVRLSMAQSSKQVDAIIGFPFSFPNVWHTVTWLSSFLLFIPGLMIITSVTNEYSYKTHRQNIIDGWSRWQFIHVKVALVVIISIVSTIFVAITAIVFGFISGSGFTLEKVEFVGYYLIQALSYSMVALLLAVLLKRSGLTIGIFFLYSFIIENFLGAIINHMGGSITNNGPGDYLPLNTVDNLIPFPFFRHVVQIGTQPSLYILFSLGAVYLFLYYYISVRKFQNQDL